MADLAKLHDQAKTQFSSWLDATYFEFGELTLEVKREHIRAICLALRDQPDFDFKQCMDVCGVDYLHYGYSEWATESTTTTGFERGVDQKMFRVLPERTQPRFAVVYHLLSLSHNTRIRLRAFVADDEPSIDSVVDIWPAVNWFEREAFDLFGIMFHGHHDLRRILTDYGFLGHPFRKDFPLIGKVEARYDAKLKRVIYEPVSIKPRILEPKVIRQDNRYQGE